MKISEFRKLIREEVGKVVRESKVTNTKKPKLNEAVSVKELDNNMKATVGYIESEGPSYNLTTFDEWTAKDAKIISFEEGSKKVLNYAKNHGASASQITKMAAKLKDLKAMAKNEEDARFVLYDFSDDLNLGLLTAAGDTQKTSQNESEAYALVIDEDGNFLMKDLAAYEEESYLNLKSRRNILLNKLPKFPESEGAEPNQKWKQAVAKLGASYDYYDVNSDGGEQVIIAAVPVGTKPKDFV